MKKAIYKIENKINHKIYIGQSIHPEQRFQEHIYANNEKNTPIHRALIKYGKENFSFEILGWFENYNDKEKEYIIKYNSKVPYGYNIQAGGNEPPVLKAENHPRSTISQETANKIINELLDWRIPRKTIVAQNKITENIIRHINEGNSWRKDNLTYPLRPPEKELNEFRALYIQWLCCSSDLPLNQLGALVGWNRSAAKMINQGHNHFNSQLKYPIRQNKEYNKIVLSQETCIDYLHFGEQDSY